jgi:hypothetical protein
VLDIVGNVEIEFGGSRGRLVADGQDFVLDVDEPSTLVGVLELSSLRTLAAGLARAGFTLHVRSGDRLLVLAGRDVQTGFVSRLLRLPRVQISPRFALRSALGRGRSRP